MKHNIYYILVHNELCRARILTSDHSLNIKHLLLWNNFFSCGPMFVNLWVRVTHKIHSHWSPRNNDNYRVLAVKDRAKTNIAVKLTYLLNIIAILDLLNLTYICQIQAYVFSWNFKTDANGDIFCSWYNINTKDFETYWSFTKIAPVSANGEVFVAISAYFRYSSSGYGNTVNTGPKIS